MLISPLLVLVIRLRSGVGSIVGPFNLQAVLLAVLFDPRFFVSCEFPDVLVQTPNIPKS